MPDLSLMPDRLLSRRIRLNLSGGKTGKDLIKLKSLGQIIPRKIGNLTKLEGQKDSKGGFLGWLWDTGSSFVGWVAKAAWNFLGFSATAIWGWVVSAVEQLKNFNWNATDKELKQMIEGQNVALASVWGSVVGQGIGWLAGIAVGYGVAFLCPVIGGAALARTIALATAKEATEELLPSLVNALRTTAATFAKAKLIQGYMSYRDMLKRAPRELLEAVYGKETADFIQKIWGREGGANYSFNVQVEEAVEAINDKAVRAFVDALLEESWDSFLEAGFIVANEIDNAYSQNKEAAAKALGTGRTVEITLDAKAETESKEKLHFVNMPQKLMLPAIQQHVNTFRMIHNRDIGLVMGLPVEEYTRAKPQSLRLVIDLYSVKQPPFYKKTGTDFVWATITVPDVKRSALNWEKIKLAVGGTNGYLWGRFRAIATLDNGRNITVYGGTEKEAEERVLALLQLSTAELQTLNISEHKKVGERIKKPRLYKNTTRIYPGFFTVLNREELLDPEKGRVSNRQRNYRDAKAKIPLWLPTEPSNANDLIRQVLTKGV